MQLLSKTVTAVNTLRSFWFTWPLNHHLHGHMVRSASYWPSRYPCTDSFIYVVKRYKSKHHTNRSVHLLFFSTEELEPVSMTNRKRKWESSKYFLWQSRQWMYLHRRSSSKPQFAENKQDTTQHKELTTCGFTAGTSMTSICSVSEPGVTEASFNNHLFPLADTKQTEAQLKTTFTKENNTQFNTSTDSPFTHFQSFQPSSPLLNPKHHTYFNSMAAVVACLLLLGWKQHCSLSPNPPHLSYKCSVCSGQRGRRMWEAWAAVTIIQTDRQGATGRADTEQGGGPHRWCRGKGRTNQRVSVRPARGWASGLCCSLTSVRARVPVEADKEWRRTGKEKRKRNSLIKDNYFMQSCCKCNQLLSAWSALLKLFTNKCTDSFSFPRNDSRLHEVSFSL